MKKITPYLLLFLIALLGVAPRSFAQTTILFESFEDPVAFTNNWVVESNYPDEEGAALWGVVGSTFGGEGIRSGTNKAYCSAITTDGAPGYLNNSVNPWYQDGMWTFMARDIDLTDFKSATLTFWYKAKIYDGGEEDFDEFFSDYMTVYIDDDAVFSTDMLTESVTRWTKVTIDLSHYAKKISNLRFEFESDFSSQEDGLPSAGEGVYIDDILVTGYPANRPDYNRDGWTDILFQNVDTRLAIRYFTNYTHGMKSEFLRNGVPIGGGWRVVGQSDFDRDGQADILFQNKDGRIHAWLMDGKEFRAGLPLGTVAPLLDWRLFTMADFNNNGSQDLVWQHLADGRVGVWYMDGTNKVGAAIMQKVMAKNVFVVGAGDFNHDGKRDLIIQDFSKGPVRARLLDGMNFIKDTTFILPAGLSFSVDWRVVGTLDMNGDGEPDLLMRHTNGSVAVWYLDGTTVTGFKNISPANPLWNVVGHR